MKMSDGVQRQEFSRAVEAILDLWRSTRRGNEVRSNNGFGRETMLSSAQVSSLLNARNMPSLEAVERMANYLRDYFSKRKISDDQLWDEFRVRFSLTGDPEKDRAIPRPTYIYKVIWKTSGHPEVLTGYPEAQQIYEDLSSADADERRHMVAAYYKAREEYRKTRAEKAAQMQAATVAASLRR